MNIKEAFDELAERFPGVYVEAGFFMRRYSNGDIDRECTVYAGGEPNKSQYSTGQTWREAIDGLSQQETVLDPIDGCDDGAEG
jgi:hypothetical protein